MWTDSAVVCCGSAQQFVIDGCWLPSENKISRRNEVLSCFILNPKPIMGGSQPAVVRRTIQIEIT